MGEIGRVAALILEPFSELFFLVCYGLGLGLRRIGFRFRWVDETEADAARHGRERRNLQ